MDGAFCRAYGSLRLVSFLFVIDSLCRSGPWRYVFILFSEFFFTQLYIKLSVGNKFYERPSPNGICSSPAFWCGVLICFYVDLARTARRVEYRDPEDVWKYTGGGKRLPSASPYNHSTNNSLLLSSLFIYFFKKMEQSSGQHGCRTHVFIHRQ